MAQSAFVTRMLEQQRHWSTQPYYGNLIRHLLSIDGKFVAIPPSGDRLIQVLSTRGHIQRYPYNTVTAATEQLARKKLVEVYLSNPTSYKLCVGYCLMPVAHSAYWGANGERVSHWVRHFWLYNKAGNKILDFSTATKTKFYGVALSDRAGQQMAQSIRDSNF